MSAAGAPTIGMGSVSVSVTVVSVRIDAAGFVTTGSDADGVVSVVDVPKGRRAWSDARSNPCGRFIATNR
jgi:hypothetical protein